MITEKLTEGSIGTVRLTRSHHGPREIVHDLKNCMSILLLCVGNLEAGPGHTARDQRTLDTLEKMIYRMNCLLEELATLFGEQGHKKKTGAPRTRAYRPQKLPAATIR